MDARTLPDHLEPATLFDEDPILLHGKNSPMKSVFELMHKIAPYDVNLLIRGESGTGKELCAKWLHDLSLRRDKPFAAANCVALGGEHLESEFFGYTRGGFAYADEDHAGLFEQACGGTVFIDDISETTPGFQARLSRVLREGGIRPVGCNLHRSVDVRIIAATSRDLEEDVRNGRFRQDLYHHLATFEVAIPPIRERRGDIVPLALKFLAQAREQFEKPVEGFSDEALRCLEAYHWPGNLDELQKEVKRMLILASGDTLGADLIAPHILRAAPEEMSTDMRLLAGIEGSLKERMGSLEARIMKETLIRNRWNKTRAAQELGLSRVGLRNKMERYGLSRNSKCESA